MLVLVSDEREREADPSYFICKVHLKTQPLTFIATDYFAPFETNFHVFGL